MNKPQFVGLSIVVATLFALTGCGGGADKEFLGSAVVECRTYDVATTAQGPITAIYTDEGQTLAAGELAAVIDTVPLVLQKREIMADMDELGASIASQEAQNKSTESDVSGAEREFNRAEELEKSGSGTEQQRDLLGTQLHRPSSGSPREATSKALVQRNKELGEARRGRRPDCALLRTAPSPGIVLTRYRNVGEVVPPANPIFNIGEFDTLYADFFVRRTELASLKLGDAARIRFDDRSPW